jgi:hypothetical protein
MVHLGGCAKRVGHSIDHHAAIPIHVCMPTNTMLGHNIAPQLYEICWQHFARSGYTMSSAADAPFTIQLDIKDLTTKNTLFSPELINCGTRVNLTLSCTITSASRGVLGSKTLTYSVVMVKPFDPVLTDVYVEHELRDLFQLAALGIESTVYKFLRAS